MDKENLRKYVEFVLRGLVDHPESLSVTLTEAAKNYVITIQMPSAEVGQIMGKKALLRRSLETVFWAAARGKGNLIEFVQLD